MTAMQRKLKNPIAHLTEADIENIGLELDAIRAEVIADRGDRDAAYIRKVIASQRKLELASRAVLLFSLEFILINLVVDVLYAVINPTIHYK